jgi:polyhydroxyalkanoate synthesis repressor PhaR
MSVLIKRYANRKLYNTKTSRYITLKGIAELIEAGEDVRVIDNETGEDITHVALSQILVDHERSNSAASRTLLSELISRGGDALYGALRRGVGDASEGIEELQSNLRRIIKNREHDASKLGEWIAVATPDFDRVVQGAMERVFKVLDLPRRGDIEALNANLRRVAEAVESLQNAELGKGAANGRSSDKSSGKPAVKSSGKSSGKPAVKSSGKPGDETGDEIR